MVGQGKAAGKTPDEPTLTRAEFDEILLGKKEGQEARHAELLKRYHDIIVWQPLSRVQLWRLEQKEATAQKYASEYQSDPRWVHDEERRGYVTRLANLLKYVHNSRWRKSLSDEEAQVILAKGVEVLGEGSDAPAFADRMTRKPAFRQPTAYTAISALIEMLDSLKSIKPDAYERFVRRDDILYPKSRDDR